MQLHFSVTFACCRNVEILVSTWCEAQVVQILKMILGKNYWCPDSPGLQVYKSASLQVCKSASLQVGKSASLQVCSLQVSHTVHRTRSSPGLANYPSQFTVLTMLLPLNISETYYEHFLCKLRPWLWHFDTPTDRCQPCKDTTSPKQNLERQHLKTVCFVTWQERLPTASKLRNIKINFKSYVLRYFFYKLQNHYSRTDDGSLPFSKTVRRSSK